MGTNPIITEPNITTDFYAQLQTLGTCKNDRKTGTQFRKSEQLVTVQPTAKRNGKDYPTQQACPEPDVYKSQWKTLK